MKQLSKWSFLFILFASFVPTGARGDYLYDIGYAALLTQLEEEGKIVPDGTGVAVTQVEASVSTGSYQYLPTSSSYTGVTITNKSVSYSGTSSWHADMVGQKIYGDASMGHGVTQVNVYYVNDWLGTGFLNYGTSLAPKTETAGVVNHSWVGTTNNSYDKNLLNRLDYSIETDDYVSVVGTNNNDTGGSTSGDLLAGAYNVISVGVSDATHVSGNSTVNSGVRYPHLVVPTATTSEATAVVSSASTLLIQAGTTMGSSNAVKSETIKTILMAGATKGEFTSWSRSDTSPLDTTYGAGELNIQESYNILSAGEQTPGSATVASTGWDYNTLSLNATTSYYIDLSASGDISIALNWNAVYTGSNYNNLSLSLANLNLYLYTVNGDGSLDSLVQQSVASSGNIEYIWAVDLSAGSYAIEVEYAGNASGNRTSYNYALAWETSGLSVVPEPRVAHLLIAVLLFASGYWLRKRGFFVAANSRHR